MAGPQTAPEGTRQGSGGELGLASAASIVGASTKNGWTVMFSPTGKLKPVFDNALGCFYHAEKSEVVDHVNNTGIHEQHMWNTY